MPADSPSAPAASKAGWHIAAAIPAAAVRFRNSRRFVMSTGVFRLALFLPKSKAAHHGHDKSRLGR
jgi:hypothetical protein